MYAGKKARSTVEDAVGKSALNIANSIVGLIDVDKMNQLKTKEDMDSDYYKELHDKLLAMKDSVGLKYLYTMRKTDDGKYIYLVDGTPYDSENMSMLGDEEEELDKALEASFEGIGGYIINITEGWGDLISAYVPIKDKTGKIVGILAADFEAGYALEALDKMKSSIIIVILVINLIGIIISRKVSYLLVRSLKELENKAEIAKQGDLTVDININSRDEIGRLTQAFKDLIGSMADITKNIRYNTKNVLIHTNELSISANETSKATEEITTAINSIADGTIEQVKSVEEVSKTMDEAFSNIERVINQADLLSDSSNQAMDGVQKVSDIFKDTMVMVNLVNSTVDNTAEIIQKLGARSKEIESFSEAISQIAKQTNLLALNAAIEAARAGENGRGFAIVSDQVKVLAEQSNHASKQINNIVNMMQKEIEGAVAFIQKGVIQASEGVDSVKRVESVLENMYASTKNAYLSVEDVISAVHVIKDSGRLVLDGTKKLVDISKGFSLSSQGVASSTQEQLAVMHDMENCIDRLNHMAIDLEKEVNKFKVE